MLVRKYWLCFGGLSYHFQISDSVTFKCLRGTENSVYSNNPFLWRLENNLDDLDANKAALMLPLDKINLASTLGFDLFS